MNNRTSNGSLNNSNNTNSNDPEDLLSDSDNSLRLLQKDSTNAYMLIYVRKSQKDKILKPLSSEDINKNIIERLESVKLLENIRSTEREKNPLLINCCVVLNHSFYHDNEDLIDVNKCTLHTHRVRKTGTIKYLYDEISKIYKVPLGKFRIWKFERRDCQVWRPWQILTPKISEVDEQDSYEQDRRILEDLAGNEYTHTARELMKDLKEDDNRILANCCRDDDTKIHIWVEFASWSSTVGPGNELSYHLNRHDKLLFVRLFNPITSKLSYVGHIVINSHSPLIDFIGFILKKAKLNLETGIKLYEDFNSNQPANDLLQGSMIALYKDPKSPNNRLWRNCSNTVLRKLSQSYEHCKNTSIRHTIEDCTNGDLVIASVYNPEVSKFEKRMQEIIHKIEVTEMFVEKYGDEWFRTCDGDFNSFNEIVDEGTWRQFNGSVAREYNQDPRQNRDDDDEEDDFREFISKEHLFKTYNRNRSFDPHQVLPGNSTHNRNVNPGSNSNVINYFKTLYNIETVNLSDKNFLQMANGENGNNLNNTNLMMKSTSSSTSMCDHQLVDNSFQLELDLRQNFESLAKATGRALRIDYQYLQFFSHNYSRDGPKSKPIQYDDYCDYTIEQVLAHPGARKMKNRRILYFHILSMPVVEYEQQWQLNVTLAKGKYGMGEQRDYSVSIKHSDSFDSIFDAVFKQDALYSKSMGITENGNGSHRPSDFNKTGTTTDCSYMSDSSGRSSPANSTLTPNQFQSRSPNPSSCQEMIVNETLDSDGSASTRSLEQHVNVQNVQYNINSNQNSSNSSNKLPPPHSPMSDSTSCSVTNSHSEPTSHYTYNLNNYRMVQFYGSRIVNIWYPDDNMEKFKNAYSNNQSKKFRIEKIPSDQTREDLKRDDILVSVFHFHQSIQQFHSVTFLIKLSVNGVYVEDVRRAIKDMTGVKDRDFEKWKFALVLRAMIWC